MKRLFSSTLKEFLERERANILSGISERNLCARFASYLEKNAISSGLRGYYADVEYNRNQGKIKTILDDKQRVITINCDIILHSRGANLARDNLIAIEMKKADRPIEEKDRDRERLRALTKSSYDGVWSADGRTLPEHICGYKLGCYVELDVNNRTYVVEEYRNGRLLRTNAEAF